MTGKRKQTKHHKRVSREKIRDGHACERLYDDRLAYPFVDGSGAGGRQQQAHAQGHRDGSRGDRRVPFAAVDAGAGRDRRFVRGASPPARGRVVPRHDRLHRRRFYRGRHWSASLGGDVILVSSGRIINILFWGGKKNRTNPERTVERRDRNTFDRS